MATKPNAFDMGAGAPTDSAAAPTDYSAMFEGADVEGAEDESTMDEGLEDALTQAGYTVTPEQLTQILSILKPAKGGAKPFGGTESASEEKAEAGAKPAGMKF